MLAPQKVAAGQVLRTGHGAPIAVGNTLPLASMPAGTQVRNKDKRQPTLTFCKRMFMHYFTSCFAWQSRQVCWNTQRVLESTAAPEAAAMPTGPIDRITWKTHGSSAPDPAGCRYTTLRYGRARAGRWCVQLEPPPPSSQKVRCRTRGEFSAPAVDRPVRTASSRPCKRAQLSAGDGARYMVSIPLQNALCCEETADGTGILALCLTRTRSCRAVNSDPGQARTAVRWPGCCAASSARRWRCATPPST